MAQVDIGKIKIVWKGPWNSGTAYTIDDAVSHSGSSYICIQAGTNQNPSSATAYWQVMAQAGTDGTDVGATLANKEIAFKTNAGAVDGIPIGTATQLLAVNSGATGYEFVNKPQGISEADLFRMTTNTGNSFSGTITNWERSDDGTFAKIGTGMSVSSGIFTFPSTGLYEVEFKGSGYEGPGTSTGWIEISTNSGSTYDQVARTDDGDDAGYYTDYTIAAYVNVTNATNFRMRVHIQNSAAGAHYGQTDYNRTYVKIIRLGDSQ